MILADWIRKRTPDGVLLGHPKGFDCGMIRVRFDQPLKTLAAQLTRRKSSSLTRRRLITHAGEHAVIARLSGTLKWHGAIMSDCSLITFEGVCSLVSAQAVFSHQLEALILATSTGTQRNRVRMCVYQPPHNWAGERRGSATVWLPPKFPRDQSMIEVTDAVPTMNSGAVLLDDLFADTVSGIGQPITVGELSGYRYEGPSKTSVRLKDHHFRYRLRLTHHGRDVHRVAFEAVVRSVEPVPSVETGSQPSLEWAL